MSRPSPQTVNLQASRFFYLSFGDAPQPPMKFSCIQQSVTIACVVVAASLVPFSALAAETPALPWKFNFGSTEGFAGGTPVSPETVFSASTGFGFEPGMVPIPNDSAAPPANQPDVLSAQVSFFSLAVPEGNYRVTVRLGAETAAGVTTVKAESRRLMLESVMTKPGEFVTRSFIVNVRNRSLPPPPKNAPGGTEVRLNEREQGMNNWDDKLTLEFNGSAPQVSAVEVEPVQVPTIFLAGDSTVTDQPREPGASWGQMLTRFLKPDIAVANHAESGETLKSFITELRLDKILSQIKAGDYLFIQFGHNDSKTAWPQTYVEPATTYRLYLKAYIGEAKRRGATPVLVTSMHRRTFDAEGKIRNSHGDYPEAVRQVAKEENVALIDLHAMSATLYEALGPEKAPGAFSAGGKDATHHNNYGAYELARCVVAGIKAAKLPLAAHLWEDVPSFDPARPDPLDTFSVPASPGRTSVRPRGD